MQKIISSPSYKSTLQEALITQRDGRFVVPVKADHRGDLPGLVHDISASGATLFVEPMGVVQANNELKELEAKEKRRSSASSLPSPPRRQALPRRSCGTMTFSSTSTSSLPAAS